MRMAYDHDLAGRMRAALSFEDGIAEKSMFGGRAFLKDGHLLGSASSRGAMMLRVNPDDGDRLVTGGLAEPFAMHGRELRGWLLISEDAIETEAALTSMLSLSLAFVASLPPKRR